MNIHHCCPPWKKSIDHLLEKHVAQPFAKKLLMPMVLLCDFFCNFADFN